MHTSADLLARLDELGIPYTRHAHPAVYTVEQARAHCGHLPGGHCKNLFLRDRRRQYWLIVLADDTEVDLRALATILDTRGLGFASPERLHEVLGVIPGAVTPLALINDRQCRARVVLEQRLLEPALLNFHPLVNTATLALTPGDLLRFVAACGHQPLLFDPAASCVGTVPVAL